MRWMLGLLVAGLLWGGAPAYASSVTNLSVATPTTSAFGARSDYVIGFTTTAALPQSGTITLTLPTGTTFGGYNTASVKLGTTPVGTCGNPAQSTTTITCTLSSQQSIAAGVAVTVTLGGITNAGASGLLTAKTSTDTTDATVAVTLVTPHSVTNVTAANSPPSNAAGARTQYVVGFTTSSTGGLSNAANSTISVTLPAGTGFGGYNTASVKVGTNPVGTCGNPSGTTVTCTLFGGESIAASTVASVTLGGITNTAGADRTVSVSTTSDGGASATISVAAAQQVSTPTVNIGAPSAAAGARTQYLIGFTTSSTGGLANAGNSQITLKLPDGTGFAGSYNTASVKVGATSVGTCGNPSGTTITCTLFGGATIAPSTAVTVALGGLVNAPAGSRTVDVSTSSDPAPRTSAPFTIVPARQVSRPTVDVGAPSAAAGARTQYVTRFTTSATGGLSNVGNSQITLKYPDGTGFAGSYNTASVKVGAASVGTCGNPSGTTITCTLFGGATIAPSTAVTVTLGGLVNAPAGARTVDVSTSSDPAAVRSEPFDVVAANPLTRLRVQIGDATPGAATAYSISFAASATGGLSNAGNSNIVLTFPAGTGFTGYNSASVRVGGQSVGTCGNPAALTITCTFFGGAAVSATSGVEILLSNLTNPATAGTLKASTSSDTALVDSGAYTTTPAPDTTISGGPSGETTDSTPTFTFSSTTAGATFECRVDTRPFAGCSGAYTTPALADGSHTVDIRAVSGGAFDATPATRTLNVTTGTPPDTTITGGPSGATNDDSPVFSFTADQLGSGFECSLDGSAFAACESPLGYGGLANGAHTFSVRALSGAGADPSPAARTFTVDTTPPPQPTPTPTPTAMATVAPAATPAPSPTPVPTPTPVPGKTVVVQPVSGKVLVKKPGTNQFAEVDASQGIPLGSTVDTKAGVVELTAKAGQKAKFFDGIFKITQSGGTTDLTLTEPLAPCRGARAAKKKPKTRKLWGDGSGSFRTRGQYSAATVRGTKWLVQDSCAGTLTKVATGVVSVRDNVKGKTILLKAGKSYLAKPRR
jgi:hypothetical protein